jgi:hypothetical protein
VEGVSKKFCRSLKRSLWYGLRDMAHELLPFGNQKSEARSQTRPPTSDLRPLNRGLLPPERRTCAPTSFTQCEM